MKRILFAIIFIFTSFYTPITSPEDRVVPVIIDADSIDYMQGEGKMIAKGNVKVKGKGVKLFCDEIIYDTEKNIANLKGNIRIEKENTTLYGATAIYDFGINEAKILDITISDPPIYGKAKEGRREGEIRYILDKGYITTCDYDYPHYKMVTKSVTIYPGQKMVAKNVIFKVGEVPILYLPYIAQSLKDDHFLANIVPGKDDEWGPFVLTRWRYTLDEHNRGNIFTDYYNKRGWGLGFTHKTENSKLGDALIKYYGITDKLYHREERKAFLEEYPTRSSIVDKYLEDDRYKTQLYYSWDPNPDLSIKAEFHKFSDQFFMKDFFELEYDEDTSPLSYALIDYSLEGGNLSLLTQKRTNSFWGQTEYLPQLEYNLFNTNIGNSKFYFESIDKLGNLSLRTAKVNDASTALRFISHNTLSYLDNVRWLTINPYVGAYTNFYSRNKFGDDDIWRVAPEMGVTLSTKLYKNFQAGWELFSNPVDRMRHVITPEVAYTYLHDPTVSSGNLFSFDGDDSLAREEKLTFTLRNKLQAKNAEKTWDFIYFSPSVTYLINPEGADSRFDQIKADLEIYPTDRIRFDSDFTYDVNSRRLTGFNFDITLSSKVKEMILGEDEEEKDNVAGKEGYSLTYGHRYSRVDSTQGTLDFNWQITPKIRLHNYLRYEYNTGDLEEQQYTIRADLHCWWLDIGLGYKKRDEGSRDTTLWFAFTLKAFPDLSVEMENGREGAKKSYN